MSRYLNTDGTITFEALFKLNNGARVPYLFRIPMILNNKLTEYAIEWCEMNNINRYRLKYDIDIENNNIGDYNAT